MLEKLVRELIKVFNDREVGQQFVNSFMIKFNIKWCPYQPNSFKGNQEKKMVDHNANLYQAVRELNLPEVERAKIISLCKTLQKFMGMVDFCFG